MKKYNVFYIVAGVVGIGIAYFIFKQKKSFLKMSDAQNKKIVADETAVRMEIRNNSNLTQQEKIEAEEKLNKQNLEKFTLEEQRAMADYNVKNLMASNTQLAVGSVDASMGLGNLQTSINLQNIKNMDFSNYNFENVDWSKIKMN